MSLGDINIERLPFYIGTDVCPVKIVCARGVASNQKRTCQRSYGNVKHNTFLFADTMISNIDVNILPHVTILKKIRTIGMLFIQQPA
jgi:hypothetical protein